MNPRPGNDDESKMRGHLGTELGNKVSDTFASFKRKDPKTGSVTFVVKQMDARGKDIDDWTFEVVDDAGGLGIPKIIEGKPIEEEERADTPENILRWINEAMVTFDWPMSRKQFKEKVFGDIGGQRNHGIQDADLQIAFNLNWVEESTIKKGGAYMIQPIQNLPF